MSGVDRSYLFTLAGHTSPTGGPDPAPTKILAFAKGEFAQTQYRF